MKSVFRFLFRKWKQLAHALGVVNTHVLLFVAYWLVFGPAALVLRLLGKDYLRLRERSANTYWLPREPDPEDLDRARYPF